MRIFTARAASAGCQRMRGLRSVRGARHARGPGCRGPCGSSLRVMSIVLKMGNQDLPSILQTQKKLTKKRLAYSAWQSWPAPAPQPHKKRLAYSAWRAKRCAFSCSTLTLASNSRLTARCAHTAFARACTSASRCACVEAHRQRSRASLRSCMENMLKRSQQNSRAWHTFQAAFGGHARKAARVK